MPERRRLNDVEITDHLAHLAGWELQHGSLHREFTFRDFAEAFAFMTRVALAAEKLDHHPDWTNVYNRVRVSLSTHDLGGISTYDFELAKRINAIAGGSKS